MIWHKTLRMKAYFKIFVNIADFIVFFSYIIFYKPKLCRYLKSPNYFWIPLDQNVSILIDRNIESFWHRNLSMTNWFSSKSL